MTEVISVKFRGRGKAYYFAPNGTNVKYGDKVIVETAKGLELGVVSHGIHSVEDDKVVPPLRPVIRLATADDLRTEESNAAREKEAIGICKQKIADHGLEMKLVDVECSFDGSKILFFFTADGRVDFRELVKDLAGVFHTRIELRQIGVRDEAKMLGGIGTCGQPFCCTSFLDDFAPVSTKMAKVQSLSLNPVKISGSCGRLMCCLRYEEDAYEDLLQHLPKLGAFVETPDGYGTVSAVNVLRQNIKVKLDKADDGELQIFDADSVAEVPGGRPAEGQPIPHVLQAKPKVKETSQTPSEDSWVFPSGPVEKEKQATPQASPANQEQNHRSNQNHHHKKHHYYNKNQKKSSGN